MAGRSDDRDALGLAAQATPLEIPGVERDPDVTVIIPARDAGATIAEALDSVLDQDGIDAEVVVVDDGSRDTTAEIVTGVARALGGERVRLARHPGGVNCGVAASRNLGLALARAPVAAFLDADDRLLPGSLAARLEVLRAHPAVALVYGSVRPDAPGLLAGAFHGRGTPGRPATLSTWLLFENPIPTSTVMVRRSAVPKSPFPQGLHHQIEDWAAWLAIGVRGQAFFIERELAVYRRTPASWSTRLEDRWVRHEQLREEADFLRSLLGGPLAGRQRVVEEALAYRSGVLCVEALGQLGRLRLGTGRRCIASASAVAGSSRVFARAVARWLPRLKLRSWFGTPPTTGPAWPEFIAS
jgi:hypothetical protein